MTRKPVNYSYTIDPLTWDIEHLNSALLHFAAMLGDGPAYLLAFADDGVIWGRAEKGVLTIAHDSFPNNAPSLRHETLQRLHLFNPQGEIRVWRDEQGFHATAISDQPVSEPQAIDERYLLWGTGVQKPSNQGFTVITEGSRGFTHAVPLDLDATSFNSSTHPVKLLVRHYLDFDDTGSAYIALTRLVNIQGGQT